MHLELWHVITIFIAIISAFCAVLKLLFMQFGKAINDRFTALQLTIDEVKKDSQEWTRVERELLRFQAEIPLHYVRREDYVRNQSIIESKLDGLALRLENRHLREGRNNEY